MTKCETATCNTNNISIHYTRTGGIKPPLILLHGLMTNGLCWTDISHALENEYDVIMPDARGHGKSSVPDFGYAYEDHANDVVGLIKDLKLQSPILLGHSMGGMTAAVIANFRPNIISGLILADPTFLNPKVQREVRDSEVADQHRKILKKTFEEIISEARIRHPNRSLEVIELFANARLQTSMAAFDVLTPPNPDYKILVSNINLPCLLLYGDKGVISSEVAEEIKKINQNIQIKKISNAGHALHFDQPKLFFEIVSKFLNSLN